MKIEDKIVKMKHVYLGTEVSEDVVMEEWQMLERVLGKQQQQFVSPLFFRAFAFAGIILFLCGGVVTIAQASKPGEILYPVKEVSQNVINEVKKTTTSVFSTVTPTPTENTQPTVEASPTDTQNKEKKEKNGSAGSASNAANASQDKKVKGISDEKPSFKSHVEEIRKNHLQKNNSQQGGDKKSENHGSAGSPQGQGESQGNSSKNK